MPFTPVLATLGYVMSPDGGSVLMIYRNRRPDDPHFGKFNGLGGKLESSEGVVSGFRRELREEAGIEATRLHLRGTISWPGFGKSGEDWFGFIFRVDEFTGAPLTGNSEGDLVWVERAQIESLNLWEGDRHFLPLVFQTTEQHFHGVMPYVNGKPTAWEFDWI